MPCPKTQPMCLAVVLCEADIQAVHHLPMEWLKCFSRLWRHTTVNIDQVLTLYRGPFIAKKSQGYYGPRAIYDQWMGSDFRKREFNRTKWPKGGCDSPCRMECCTSSGWMAKSVSSCAGGKHRSLGSFRERSLETAIRQWGGEMWMTIRWCNVRQKSALIHFST